MAGATAPAFSLGSAFGSLPPVLDGTCTEPYRGLAEPRFAPSTRRTRETVADVRDPHRSTA
jgi:hypothetical protein